MAGSPFTLVPYLPRLLIDWQREAPAASFREVEGTLVFVDISGFTKMSERLARRGKEGSEEVTDVLNSTFTRLLAVAYEDGGSLLKFGGDALLLFFSGSEHPARACHAAVGMRAKLREIGSIKTSAGGVKLRMSIGIHSGVFHFFLVGSSHRELIVSGPAASRTVAMEQAATAGEILVSAEVAATLDETVLGEERAGGRLLKRSPPPAMTSYQSRRGDTAEINLGSFIPTAVRARIASGAGEQEHRQVVVAFLHFNGLDDRVADDPAAAAAALNTLVVTVQAAVEQNDITFLGTDIDADGGKLILIAGAPQASDNDDEGMLRALRSIVDASGPIPLNIGVNRGHVFVGDVGPDFRRTYTVMGDAVNLAARLMSRADAGQIVASREILERAATLFAATPLEPFMVKGKANPVTASLVGAASGMRTREQRLHPLVGREKELRMLLDGLAAARSGSGRVVEIVGDAGLGKTRLALELAQSCEAGEFIGVICEQYEASTPYFSFRGLVRKLAGVASDADAAEAGGALAAHVHEVAPSVEPWLPLLATVAGVEVAPTPESDRLAPEFRSARLREAAAAYLLAALPAEPVLSFEDLHWMDEASADLLRHLIAQILPTHPWLIVATTRPEGQRVLAEASSTRTVTLEPLSRESSADLVVAAGEHLPQSHIAALADRGGGHPLFLLELVASAGEGASGEELPSNVEAVITARIDTLNPRDRSVLRYASVLGEYFDTSLLAGVLDEDAPDVLAPQTWRRLDGFVQHIEGTSYKFRQALFRDAAYEGLPFRRRRMLHGRAGAAIERRRGARRAALLSVHFHRAENWAKSWEYSRRAGDEAKAAFANVEAATLYRRALEAATKVIDVETTQVASVAESLGDVSEIAGLYDDAANAYRQARKRASAEQMPGLMLKEGTVRERLGLYSEALRWYARGFKAADALEDAGRRESERAHVALGAVAARLRQGQYRQAIKLGTEAASSAESSGDRAALARACFLLDWAYGDLGQSEESARYSERALALYEELDDLVGQGYVHNNIGMAKQVEGDWEAAHRHFLKAMEAAERAGHVVHAAVGRNNIGEIRSDQGRIDEAEPLFRDALRVWRAAKFPALEAHAISNLGRAAARMGNLDQADQLLSEALRRQHEIGVESMAAETDTRLAERALYAGDSEAALATATTTLDTTTQLGGMTALQACLNRIRGYAHMQAGENTLAQDCLDESLRLARQAGAQFELALTLEAWSHLARLTGRRSAAKYAGGAREIFDRLGVVRTPVVPLPG